jgi:hypothetical protein
MSKFNVKSVEKRFFEVTEGKYKRYELTQEEIDEITADYGNSEPILSKKKEANYEKWLSNLDRVLYISSHQGHECELANPESQKSKDLNANLKSLVVLWMAIEVKRQDGKFSRKEVKT